MCIMWNPTKSIMRDLVQQQKNPSSQYRSLFHPEGQVTMKDVERISEQIETLRKEVLKQCEN